MERIGTSVTKDLVLYFDDVIGSTVVTNTTATTTRLRYDPFGLRIAPTNPSTAPYICVMNTRGLARPRLDSPGTR